jgi:hypothetical protein
MFVPFYCASFDPIVIMFLETIKAGTKGSYRKPEPTLTKKTFRVLIAEKCTLENL